MLRDQIVYDMICHAADLGLPCPTDQQLAHGFGAKSRGMANRVVVQLVKDGRIKIERPNLNTRICIVIATGARTAQPVIVPRPKYTSRVNGANTRRKAERASDVMTTDERLARVEGGPKAHETRIEVDIVGKPPTCQFPHGNATPYRFCGKQTKAGSSYCRDHHAICWRPIQPRRAK